jgi:20S proteasome subunit beta 4
MVIKFDFNCILIDKNGIHHMDLTSSDPTADLDKPETLVDAPNPPVEVGA